ncbi:MAG: chitinase, partial [Microthrixaceae bacterium]
MRVMVAMFLVAAVAGGSVALVRRTLDDSATGAKDAWFAPYVDATLVPTYPFENPANGAPKDVVLGFVVADRDGGCEPTWGTFVDLQGAATAFDLDRRIARLRSAGGEPVVSFGGLTNDELALRCSTPDKLADAYGKVVSRYHLSTIDIDVEGAALADDQANLRRGAALTTLQKKAAKNGQPLAVWLTVPVGVDGMTEAGQKLVSTTIAAGVDLAGVNGMVMDYGAGRPAGTSMAQANEQALLALHRQLSNAYQTSGTTLTSSQVWAKVGATPMIGQNDTKDDVFTLGDARSLLAFARVHGMGRLSMWSANRDAQCGKQIEDAAVSNTCSSLEQEPGEFGKILDGLSGRPVGTGSNDDDGPSTTIDRTSARGVVDDARTSPYPIWQDDTPYLMSEKVVWHGNVYEAKWWTRTDMP